MSTDALLAFRQAVRRIVTDPAMPDLTLRQLAVLMRVADVPKGQRGASTGEVAAEFMFRKPTVTRAVQRLVAAGFVVSMAAPMDARKVEISATQEGRAFIAKVTKAMQAA